MTRSFAVGVAGCGSIANDRHIPALQSLPNVEVAAVYDHRWETAEETATRHGVPRPFADLDDFVAEPLDFVTVASPPFTHADIAVPALEAGLDVLTEKPMAVDRADAREMVATADETGQQLGVVHNFLYADSVLRAKDLLASGAVGEVRYVKGFQLSSRERGLPEWYPDLPGGLFFDESPHLLYLMEYFLGDLSVRSATAQTVDAPRQLESMTATYDGALDRVGQLTMTFDAPLSEWFLVVVGTERVLVVDIFRDILLTFDSDGTHAPTDVLRTALSGTWQWTRGVVTSGLKSVRGDLYFGFDELAAGFVDSLDSDAEPPETGADGARILDHIYDTLDAAGVYEE